MKEFRVSGFKIQNRGLIWFDYIDNPIDLIKSAEEEFHEKVGRAWRLKIITYNKLSQ